MRGASPTSVSISCGVIARQALGVALLKAFQRARTLYLLTVTLTLMFAALSVQLGLGVFVAGAIAFYRATQPPASLESVLVFNQVFAKVNLSIGRLIVFTGFLTFAFSLLTVAWAPIDRALRWLLLPLSQHALSAYTLHLFVTALIMRMKLAGLTGRQGNHGEDVKEYYFYAEYPYARLVEENRRRGREAPAERPQNTN
jgi:OpgC protein